MHPEHENHSIAIPFYVGCGLAGGQWSDKTTEGVKPILNMLQDLAKDRPQWDIAIYTFQPPPSEQPWETISGRQAMKNCTDQQKAE